MHATRRCTMYTTAALWPVVVTLGLQLRRPDLIDPALLRPGRLDVLLYVGVAEDSHSKLKVLQALTRKFVMEDDIDLGIIAEKCPPTFTGADMYALSSDAWMTALKRTVAQVWLSLWFVVLTSPVGAPWLLRHEHSCC